MRFKYNKEIEFFFKKYLFPKKFLYRKRLERSINNLDENEIKLVKNFIKPGTDSIDVGVYRGVYSYEMSKYSNIVHAFEPNPIIFDDLRDNLIKLKKNINLYNFALSDKSSKINLKVPIRNKNFKKENYEEYYKMGRATIHNENNMREFENVEIFSKKLDEINFKNQISFIKIDVEGHEIEVINGAIQTINRFKPNLLVEIEKKYTQKNISESLNYIISLGYNSFVYQNDLLKNTLEISELDSYNNYIFIPS